MVGKKLEGGTIMHRSWRGKKLRGATTYASESYVLPEVGANTDLSGIGLEDGKWIYVDGYLPYLDMTACRYTDF